MNDEERIEQLLRTAAPPSLEGGEHREWLEARLLAAGRRKRISERAVPVWQGLWATSCAIAAAALLVFALSRAQFTIIVGSARLAWGRLEPDPAAEGLYAGTQARLGNVERQLAEGETSTRENRRMIEVLYEEALHNRKVIQQAADRLAREQHREAEVRYSDMRKLIRQWGLYAMAGNAGQPDNALLRHNSSR